MPVPLVATLLLLCLPALGQDLEIDPYLPLVVQGQWHPLVWEALIPVRTPDPASYLANLPRPLPVEPTVPLPVVVPLPLAHPATVPRTGKDARATGGTGFQPVEIRSGPSTGKDARATVPGPVAVVVPPNPTSVPHPIATFPPPGGKDKGGAVNVVVPPNATGVPPPVTVAVASGGSPLAVVVPTVPGNGQPLAAPVAVTAAVPPPGPVTPADDGDTILLARLNAGDQSKEMARELTTMDPDRLTGLLERLKLYGQEQAADALAKVFLALPQVALDNRRDWSRNVTLQVAGALGRRMDRRCVELFEELLASRSERSRTTVWELAGLADYHRRRGDWVRAADAQLRTAEYCDNPDEVALSLVGAARSLARGGRWAEACKLYDRVEQFGYGWATGIACMDRAERLIRDGRHVEARAVLKRPIEGRLAEQVRLGMRTLLAESYHLTGEADLALACCRKVIEDYESLPSPLRNEGLEGMIGRARRLLAELGGAEPKRP